MNRLLMCLFVPALVTALGCSVESIESEETTSDDVATEAVDEAQAELVACKRPKVACTACGTFVGCMMPGDCVVTQGNCSQ